MRTPFTHRALLLMPPGGDMRAPGAAITLELCLTGPDGATTRWVFSSSTVEVPTPRDVEHARRLAT
ncbi:MAG: hypothetical protein K0R37_2468 [Arthrobacter sp.]|jgi:hypothetical protein|nr:hypothetical protein [Arthrobacter sp.]